MNRKITLHDMCLRDGMHAMHQKMPLEVAKKIAFGLDAAGVEYLEIGHGDGLGGSSVNYGFSQVDDEQLLREVVPQLQHTKASVLVIPGIGTASHIKMAKSCGVSCIRVATHCTEADISRQHIEYARELGMEAVGFLMMSHMISAEELLEQARLMEAYGADCVYCTDSAGYMLGDEVREKISLLRRALNDTTKIGFHAHNNLGIAISNSIIACESGAERIDGSCAGLGAGAGNTPLEVFNAVALRCGYQTDVDITQLAEFADGVVYPKLLSPIRIDTDSLLLGYAGVYSSFLHHVKRASQKHAVPTKDILFELGNRKIVGGQEDMIEDVALDIKNA